LLFRLAGHLKMTVAELGQRMDSRELSEWIAYTRHFEALPDPWRQTSLLTSAVLSPHCKQGRAPKSDAFIPIEEPPQHPEQIRLEIEKLMRQLHGE
jgi:hypothetical protein